MTLFSARRPTKIANTRDGLRPSHSDPNRHPLRINWNRRRINEIGDTPVLQINAGAILNDDRRDRGHVLGAVTFSNAPTSVSALAFYTIAIVVSFIPVDLSDFQPAELSDFDRRR